MKRNGLILLALLAFLSGCMQYPAPPVVTVEITAVRDTTAVAQGVSDALTGTAFLSVGLTETVFAQGGITLTPSDTPTPTRTPTLTPTRFVTRTPSPTPSDTPTPTYIPAMTNTPAQGMDVNNGWIRVINAWSGPEAPPGLDVFINDERIAYGLTFRDTTGYFRVPPGTARISIRQPEPTLSQATLATSVVSLAPGDIVTLVAVKLNEINAELLEVREDTSPLAVNTSRLTIVHANPVLLPSDLVAPEQQRILGTRLQAGNVVGALDLPSGDYAIDFLDSDRPEQVILSLPPLELIAQVNYLLLLLPPANAQEGLTSYELLRGVTRRVENDVTVRVVNALALAPSLRVSIDGRVVFENLPQGAISDPIPLSRFGARFWLTNANETVQYYDGDVGLGTEDNDTSDRVIILYNTTQGGNQTGEIRVLPQNANPSAINATVRLIHALPGAIPLALQLRPSIPTATPASSPEPNGPTPVPIIYQTAGSPAQFGGASDYVSRNPDVYSVRVVQAGTQTVIAEFPSIQLLAGGVYDFIVVGGTEAGAARLALIQPDSQTTDVFFGSGNPTAVFEAVSLTLTAAAPTRIITSATPVDTPTPTATRTPIPTNTPRPTNTPDFVKPLLVVNPAPPDTTFETLSVNGQNFQPGLPYVITLDEDNVRIFSGTVNDDGTILAVITLPENITPGPHFLRVCVDCSPRGAQQEQFAVFIVANSTITPTPTAQP